jgi:DamX protein
MSLPDAGDDPIPMPVESTREPAEEPVVEAAPAVSTAAPPTPVPEPEPAAPATIEPEPEFAALVDDEPEAVAAAIEEPPEATTIAARSEEQASESLPEMSVEDWVVQIGAYPKFDSARNQVAAIGIDGLSIVPTVRDGQPWYLILLGVYPSRGEAELAGEAYVESRRRASYWVRSVKSVQRLAQPDAGD